MPVRTERLIGLIRERLPEGQTIGIALSGGGDSTALLHLALRAGFRVRAVTVDHGLRPESAAEAAAVGRDCTALGVAHEVRVWTHGEIQGNLMDAARRARMALIADWARGAGIAHVALGHTRDDQAETFLMGLARQAGIAGLSGMRRIWAEQGVTFHRPLLDAGRAELRDWLSAQGIAWIDDPTNENNRFQRVRARAVLAALAPLGITAEGLAGVAGHLAQVQAALAVQVRAAAAHLRVEAGALQVGLGLWEEPEEVQRQVLVAALRWLNGADYAPRAADLARFACAMRAGRAATLAGVRFTRGWLCREARVLGRPVAVGEVWDGRWQVTGPEGEVRSLGGEGLRQVPGWRATGLPREVLAVTPAVWRGDVLHSAPLAGWPNGWSARLDAPEGLFGLCD